jgi:hypothetical protein
LSLVHILDQITSFCNIEQYNLAMSTIEEYKEKITQVDKSISELKKYNESIQKRYNIVCVLLMVLSLLTILFFCLISAIQVMWRY